MKKILLLIVAAALVVAFVKNPSAEQAQAEVKAQIVEEMQDGNIVASFLAPVAVDNLVTVDVDNYYVFSTFDSYVSILGNKQPVSKGYIVFGKVFTSKE